MIHHHMGLVMQLFDDADTGCFRLNAFELDAGIRFKQFNATQAAQKIKMPEGTPKLTIGDGLQANGFLIGNKRLDLLIFDLCQSRRVNFSSAAISAGRFSGFAAQQAADMVSPKGRLIALHGLYLLKLRCFRMLDFYQLHQDAVRDYGYLCASLRCLIDGRSARDQE
jgi:hypothetical protein